MNRTDTSAHIREVCRMFKERGMMLRTTLMVGFPGETDEDFNELMDFVKQTKFDRMGAFMFCPEDGTRAAEMPNQIPEEVKQERYDRLMTLQHGISLAQNKARVGTTCRVLVEKKRGSRYVGRSEYEAPETDGSIFFGSEEPCEIGSFVNVKITGAKAYDLMGERDMKKFLESAETGGAGDPRDEPAQQADAAARGAGAAVFGAAVVL